MWLISNCWRKYSRAQCSSHFTRWLTVVELIFQMSLYFHPNVIFFLFLCFKKKCSTCCCQCRLCVYFLPAILHKKLGVDNVRCLQHNFRPLTPDWLRLLMREKKMEGNSTRHYSISRIQVLFLLRLLF